MQQKSRKRTRMHGETKMYKVRRIKDYGQWCRKGKIMYLNNQMAESMSKKGNVEIMTYL